MSDTRPIGVFDSGLGGLSCIKTICKRMPNENVVYFGDTARTPYGDKAGTQSYGLLSRLWSFWRIRM